MNVGLVVDSTCDIPFSILDRFNVYILPTEVFLKKDLFIDRRIAEETNTFYNEVTANSLANAKSTSCSSASFIEALTEDLMYKHDHLLVVAPHFKLSDSLQNIREALLETQLEFDRLRKQAHLRNAFKVRILESQTGYAGYGLVLYETLRLMSEKARSVDQLKKPIDEFKQTVQTLVLPGHQKFNYQMLANPPFNFNWLTLKKLKITNTLPTLSVSHDGIQRQTTLKFQNVENDFFNMLYDELTRTNLKNKLVNLSYAGNLSKLRVLTSFKSLQEHIISKGGKIVYSQMSPTSAAQLGSGAITVAYAN
jgi:fatty acid-binding protein DegV